ncbi:MAG: 6-bladed beta-propeller [bacterium]
MFSYHLQYIFIVLMFLGCGSKSKFEDDRSIVSAGNNNILADSLFSVIKEIQLETISSSIISFPYLLYKHQDNLIISSRGMELKVFSVNGKYIKNIGRLGDGPGEYRDISTCFNIDGENFGVFDPKNKRVTIFNSDGVLFNTYKFNIYDTYAIQSIVHCQNKYYIHSKSYWKGHPELVYETDSVFNIIRGFISADEKYYGYFYRNLIEGHLIFDDQRLCLYEVNSMAFRLNIIDPFSSKVDFIEISSPSFFKQLTPLPKISSSEFSVGEYRKATHPFKLFVIGNRYLIIQYLSNIYSNKFHAEVARFDYFILDLEKRLYVFASGGLHNPTYGDGTNLYNVMYNRKEDKNDDESFVRNPKILIYQFNKRYFEQLTKHLTNNY